jgi:pimeloyl-ACP methyl ester carboxylesterase
MVTAATLERSSAARVVTLASGIRLRVVERGPADAPAVLMLHGYTDSSFSFSRVLPLLPSELRVVVPDQRGHGDSDRPLAGYGVDDFAADALALLDALKIDCATVVGHSMGSFVARQVAARAPERVRRLVLIGTGPTARNEAVRDLFTGVRSLADPVDEAFVRDFQTSMIGRPVPKPFLERVIADSRKVPARVWRAALEELIAFTPGPVAVPTLVIGGDCDLAFSAAEQAAAAAGIPGARLHLESGVGHSLQWEAPERFVELAFGRRN